MRYGFAIAVVLVGVSLAGAQIMAGAYSLSGPGGSALLEDFDSMGQGGIKAPGPNFLQTYWSATSNNNNVEWALGLNNPEGTGPNGDSWGGAESCYNAAGIETWDGSGVPLADRTLTVYKSQPSAYGRLTTRLINDTGADMTAFTISFDHEAKWFAFADPSISGRQNSGQMRLQYSLDGGTTWLSGEVYVGSAYQRQAKSYIDNLGMPAGMTADKSFVNFEQGWLTDAAAEDLGKIHRGVGGIVPLASPLADGAELRIRFDGWVGDQGSGTPGDPRDQNINHGIDNLRIVGAASPGDIDVNGSVGLSDLSILAGNYGTTDRTWGQGDLDGDSTVGLSDLSILAGNYGNDVYATAVPEPAVLGLLLAGGLVAIRRRK